MVTKSESQPAKHEASELSVLRRLGTLFERARIEQGLSDRELGRLAGISRQHVRFATHGGNITIVMLLRLTRALHIPSRALSDLGLHVFAALRHIEEAASHLSEAATALRGETPEEVGETQADDTDAQAAALVREFAANAKKLGPESLALLDVTLRGLVASSEQAAVSDAKQQRTGTGWRRPK
jgi:transcriptional regulator with XRE-family HTH domain